MMQFSITTVAKPQSSPPSASWSSTLKRLPFSARTVSLGATSPIAFTVSENDNASGVKTTPMWVRSTECSASALSANDGVNASIGVMLTCSPSSSVYETASLVFQSAIARDSLSEVGDQRHDEQADRGSVLDLDEHIDAAVGTRGDDLGILGRGTRRLR